MLSETSRDVLDNGEDGRGDDGDRRRWRASRGRSEPPDQRVCGRSTPCAPPDLEPSSANAYERQWYCKAGAAHQTETVGTTFVSHVASAPSRPVKMSKPDEHEHDPRDPVDDERMPVQPPQERLGPIEEQRDEQETARPVRASRPRAAARASRDIAARARQARESRRESDRRTESTRRERHAHHQRRGPAELARGAHVDPRLTVEPRHLDDAEHQNAERDDEQPADLLDDVAVLNEELAQHRGGRAKCHEDEREAQRRRAVREPSRGRVERCSPDSSAVVRPVMNER